jgi:hypothetical protein
MTVAREPRFEGDRKPKSAKTSRNKDILESVGRKDITLAT